VAEAVMPARHAAEPPGPVTIPGWNDGWPSLAAALPLRGVVQQLALQSELIECQESDGALAFHLRIAVETLRSSGSPEKLEAALADQLARRVRLSTEIGPVSLTANALATAQRELRQREAEQKMHSDPFVQTLMREFGATVVPGSVRPN
ncbi:MAG: DNA polymerase III subunit gamma/tau C-terminal domain-containing protein, partial [Lacisediminimonas sp.]|nr:DNA polymerase III subunit gamma/tau C-terminal domain-containing protein [Lacisediminimonas sp.]